MANLDDDSTGGSSGPILPPVMDPLAGYTSDDGSLFEQVKPTLIAFGRRPKRFILGFVVAWLLESFVTPLVDAVLFAGETAVEAILIVFGVGPTRTGLADIPMLIVGPLIAAAEPSATAILAEIGAFNQAIAAVAMGAGLAGPPAVALLWVIEGTAVTWILWRIVRIVDIPFINLGPLLQTLAAPVKTLFGVIR